MLHYTFSRNWTSIGPCIANIFADYNQQDATFHNLFIPVRRSTCFRRVFRPSSGAQNCVYSVRYMSEQYSLRASSSRKLYCSDKYLTLYVQFWAPVDGRKTRLKHVERLTEINWEKSHLVACTLITENLSIHKMPHNNVLGNYSGGLIQNKPVNYLQTIGLKESFKPHINRT